MDAGAAGVAIHGDAKHSQPYVHLGDAITETITGIKTFSSVAKFLAGTNVAPGLAFSAETTTGLYRIAAGDVGIAAAVGVSLTNAGVGSYARIALGSLGGSLALGLNGTLDASLYREAAAYLLMRNGAVSQRFAVAATYTDASNYEIGELGWSGVTLRVGTSHAGTGAARSLALMAGGTERWTIDGTTGHLTGASGLSLLLTAAPLYIGDTSNAQSVIGLTINQDGNDDEILSLKSSDVAHGVTTITETDTFGRLYKFSGPDGGLAIGGLADTGATGLYLRGIAVSTDTVHSSAGVGAVIIDTAIKSGAGIASIGGLKTMVALRDNGASRHLFVANGAYYLVGTTTGDQIGNGEWYLNDNSNANSTLGLTLNQGANDDHILSLKSSDVAHGVTTITETDTFGFADKFSATDGGLSLHGLCDTGATGLRLRGIGVTADATRSIAGVASLMLDSALKSGAGVATTGANVNMVAVRDNGTTRFILDSDGDSHQDVGTAWTNFDDFDDADLCKALAMHVSRPGDPLRAAFGDVMGRYNRGALERARLVAFNDDGHHFVNMSRLTMLNTSAIHQVHERLTGRLATLERELSGVREQLRALGQGEEG